MPPSITVFPVKFELSPVRVRFELSPDFVKVPLPDIVPETVSSTSSANSSSAPFSMVVFPPKYISFCEFLSKIMLPPEMVVSPVNPLLSPETVSVPVPDFWKSPSPKIVPPEMDSSTDRLKSSLPPSFMVVVPPR